MLESCPKQFNGNKGCSSYKKYLYPDIHAAYQLSQQLNWIFESTKEKIYAYTRLAQWHEKVTKSGFKSFNTISKTIMNHYKTILNYFDNRSTNASADRAADTK
jgi:transposase